MVIVHTKHGQRIEVPNGAAVTATTLPVNPGCTPAAALAIVATTGETLAVFRVAELAGYDLSTAGADA